MLSPELIYAESMIIFGLRLLKEDQSHGSEKNRET